MNNGRRRRGVFCESEAINKVSRLINLPSYGRECTGSRDTHLPDTTEVSQVEDVVKLGRRRQHLQLGTLPELACRRHQLLNVLLERLDKATLLNDREQHSIPSLRGFHVPLS